MDENLVKKIDVVIGKVADDIAGDEILVSELSNTIAALAALVEARAKLESTIVFR